MPPARAENVKKAPPTSRPWRPMAIFAWSLLDGPLFGGIWAAANAPRLGLKQQVGPALLMGVVCSLFPWVIASGLNIAPTSGAALTWALLFRVLAAYYYLFTQREAFWNMEDAGARPAGSLWWVLAGLLLLPLNFRAIFVGG